MTDFCIADGICVPYLVNEMLREAEQPLYEQNFGLGLKTSVPLRCGYLRPWRLIESADSGVSKITHNKEGLKINLDIVDNCVVIQGKHEEKSDEHGFVSR